MNQIYLNLKHTIFFALAFIFFTVIGTLSHEYGHILVAQALGYNTTLHYGSMSYDAAETENGKRLSEIRDTYQNEIEHNLPFEYEAEYNQTLSKLKSDRLWIRIGGPLQTMLTGTIGFVFLLFRKQKIKLSGMRLIDWLAVFFTLFWLRQVFNLFIRLAKGILGKSSLFGGDEANISYWLDLPAGTLSIISAAIGFWICTYTIFKIIPNVHRFNSILGGLAGGIIGFIFWMTVIGPIILP